MGIVIDDHPTAPPETPMIATSKEGSGAAGAGGVVLFQIPILSTSPQGFKMGC